MLENLCIEMERRKIITQIGSLPYTDIKKAVEYSLRHDIPFLPELPLLGDSMLEYIKNPGELSCLQEFTKHTFSIVKIQCIGPATLISNSYKEEEALQRIYDHISVILDKLKAESIILFFDEPALGAVSFEYKELWNSILDNFDNISHVGVHICGNMNWDELFDSNIEIISFDASMYDITVYPNYRRGKRISWGIQKFEDLKDFQEGDLITLPCGMSPKLYTEEDCEKNLHKLIEIAEKIQ